MIVWEPSYEGLHESHGQKILKHIIISSVSSSSTSSSSTSSSSSYLTSSTSSFVPRTTTSMRSTWIANIVYVVIMLLVATTRTPAVTAAAVAAGLPSSSSLHQVVDKSETHLLAKSIEIQCPVSNSCPCHKYEDGLFLNCDGTTSTSLRSILENITSPIHTLSIYDFDRSVTSLSQDVFQAAGINIKILTFTHSHLETLKDNSLRNLRASLESLSIANGKLVQIPTKSLTGLTKLTDLYFDYNEITRIEDYSFFGLRLTKLSMKGNRLRDIPEHSFSGLEKSLQDIDLSENQLKIFPMWSLKLLENLRVLRLSINRISTFDSNRTVNLYRNYQLHSLSLLDLSSNNFMAIHEDSLRPFPSLKTLSLYSNQITSVHKNSFKFLKDLVSLDMSHNRIIYLDSSLFERNKRLKTIDLSHNHIHSINGVFCNLPKLHEIFLSENNILELSSDAFTNSTALDVIYLESNAIRHIDPMSFSTLTNLTQLHLRSNFIPLIPVTLFDKTIKLISISLDDNEIVNLEIGMFRKLSNLKEIRLHNNRIKEVKKGVFEPLPKLMELQLQNNLIEIIEQESFSTLRNLQELNIQNNKLLAIDEILPNTPNASLQILQLNHNNIVEIHLKSFQNLENITILRLNDNKLRRIDKSLLVDMKKLEKIYLSNNEISEIEKDAFTTIRYLRFLDLSRNRLKHIRKEFFVNLVELEELIMAENYIDTIDSFSFRALKKLKVLDLSGNRLVSITKDIFQFQNDLSSLTQLNLRNCSLQRIEANSFKSLTNLNDINLEENHLKAMDVQSLDIPSLHSLKLSGNNFLGGGEILSGMFDKLRSLQQLTLANCNISHLPENLFQKNTNLVRLDLRENHFTELIRGIFSGLNVFKELRLCRNNLSDFPHIALYNISTLELLTLSGNYLTAIDFFKLSGTLNLRHLDLRDNRISLLQGFNAVNLTQLDYIDLSGNSLASLPRNFLQHSINLQRVDLSENRFLQIPSSVLSDTSLPRLQWLNLTGNPIDTIYTVKEERYPYLKELYICGTSLTILTSKDFEAFQALQHLHLIRNRINRISPGAFKSLSNLLTLDVSVNELEKLPKERLQGLKSLRLLNISHNSLRDLEEFSSDLEQLQICDLSYNQLDNIDTKVFHNLKGLIELHLVGNRLTVIYSDAFRYLSKLQILDLRKNYFEVVPLEALKPLETNVRTLKIEENPLHCSCETQQLWEWLRDHRKWTTDDNVNYLRCEQPDELRGKIFSEMEPQQFCDAPLIPKIAIQDIQPFSVVVSWQNQQNFGLTGYEVLYHELDGDGKEGSQVRGKRLNSTAYSAKLYNLTTNTRYHICVIGIGNWIPEHVLNALYRLHSSRDNADERRARRLQEQQDQNDSEFHYPMNQSPLVLRDDYSTGYISSSSSMYAIVEDEDNYIEIDSLLDVLKNSHYSTCTDVQTLDPDPSQLIETNGLSSHSFLQSLLTRRLGLIVGACLGIVVFIILATMLSYYKLKRQRLENLKRQQNPQTMSMPMPPEYISYRHFSIPNDALHSTSTSSSVIGLANGPSKVLHSSSQLKTPSPICEKVIDSIGNGNGVAIISNNEGVVGSDNSDSNNHQHHHLHNHQHQQHHHSIPLQQNHHHQQIQIQQAPHQQQQQLSQIPQQISQNLNQQQQISQNHQIPHHHSNYMSGVVLGTNNLTAC